MASGHKMMTLLLVASVLVLLLSMVTAMAQAVSPAPAPVSDAAPAAEVFKVYQLLKGWSHLSGYVDWDQC